MEIQGSEQLFKTKLHIYNEKINYYKNMDKNSLDDKKTKEVCQEFESLFIDMMFKQMRKNINKNGLLNYGLKEEIFDDMLYTEYSRLVAKNGGIGLADMIYRSLMLNKKSIQFEK